MVLYTQVMYSGTYTSTLEHYSKGRQILTGKNIVSLVAHGHIIKAIKKKLPMSRKKSKTNRSQETNEL